MSKTSKTTAIGVGIAFFFSFLALFIDFQSMIRGNEIMIESGGYPVQVTQNLKFVGFVIALALGGATLLYVIYMMVRYSDAMNSVPKPLPEGWMRIPFGVWTGAVALLILMTVMMSMGGLAELDKPPEDKPEMTVDVTGMQFAWMVDNPHIDGGTTMAAGNGKMRVPTNTVVHLNIKSRDVIHSFAVQALGFKVDAVPGQTNTGWIMVEEPGTYSVNCAELCGSGHSKMAGNIQVMPQDEYEEWVEENGGNVSLGGEN
ncbi:cytochrome c oxidase subunit II [Halorutilales archaeon Cl-col2-1]